MTNNNLFSPCCNPLMTGIVLQIFSTSSHKFIPRLTTHWCMTVSWSWKAVECYKRAELQHMWFFTCDAPHVESIIIKIQNVPTQFSGIQIQQRHPSVQISTSKCAQKFSSTDLTAASFIIATLCGCNIVNLSHCNNSIDNKNAIFIGTERVYAALMVQRRHTAT